MALLIFFVKKVDKLSTILYTSFISKKSPLTPPKKRVIKTLDQDLAKLLEDSGFTQKESLVYLALLELKQGTVRNITKITGLKRPIIYVILEGLIKRGYASEIPDKKINTYKALDPSVILKRLQITAKNFSEMLPLLQTLCNKGKTRPKIQYLESKEAIWKIYEDMCYSKTPFFITSYDRINKHFPGATDSWIKNYKRGFYKDLCGRHLCPAEDINIARQFKKINQDVRILKNLKDSRMDFTLDENKLSISSLGEEPFLVLIESEELAKSIKPIFEIAWKAGRPL